MSFAPASSYSDAALYVYSSSRTGLTSQSAFSICLVAVTISTALRLYVRAFMTRRQLQLDDYLVIGAYVRNLDNPY